MTWSVPSRYPLLEAAGALAFVVAALVVDDPVARAGAVAAAVLLAVLAVRDRVARVRLLADEQGVTVLAGFAGRHRLGWQHVDDVRLDARSRLGRTLRLVEIDAGERLYLLSERDLGADPEAVVAALQRLRA